MFSSSFPPYYCTRPFSVFHISSHSCNYSPSSISSPSFLFPSLCYQLYIHPSLLFIIVLLHLFGFHIFRNFPISLHLSSTFVLPSLTSLLSLHRSPLLLITVLLHLFAFPIFRYVPVPLHLSFSVPSPSFFILSLCFYLLSSFSLLLIIVFPYLCLSHTSSRSSTSSPFSISSPSFLIPSLCFYLYCRPSLLIIILLHLLPFISSRYLTSLLSFFMHSFILLLLVFFILRPFSFLYSFTFPLSFLHANALLHLLRLPFLHSFSLFFPSTYIYLLRSFPP